MKFKSSLVAFVCALPVLLNACSGGGDGAVTIPVPLPTIVSLQGAAQKGPFAYGSNITITTLLHNGATGAQVAATTTKNNLGEFSVDIVADQLVQIEAQGEFLDELAGITSLLPITLRSIGNVSTAPSQLSNVNVLTHIAAPRIRGLLATGGLSESAAIEQSQLEVLATLALIVDPPAIDSFGGLGLYSATKGDPGSAYLVTMSTLFAESARQLSESNGSEFVLELQNLLDALADDLSDGVIADAAILNIIRSGSTSVVPDDVSANLSDLATDEGSADFAGDIHLFLDSDQDGDANAVDDDDDGDGVADEQDAYPYDAICHLSWQGDGVRCDSYVPKAIDIDSAGVIYLLSRENRRVYRWDSITGQHLEPLAIGLNIGPGSELASVMTYHSAHSRLYLGYENGVVSYFDVATDTDEQLLAKRVQQISGLVDIGSFLLAQQGSDFRTPHIVFDASGTPVNIHYRAINGSELAFSPALSRVYSVGRDYAINYEDIDPDSGLISDPSGAEIRDLEMFVSPLRVSVDGEKLLFGSGGIVDARDISWLSMIPGGFVDGRFVSQDKIVVLRPIGDDSLVEYRDATGATLDTRRFSGTPLAVIPSGAGFIVITSQGQPAFHYYQPSDDSDGDGIVNTQDSFPFDPAASADSDRDGYPDEWTPGMTGADSTTGLTLDAYANDSACFLIAHGDGSTCDIGGAVPDYVPETIDIDSAGVIYLFSPESQRVLRWDAVTGSDLNPVLARQDRWLSTSTLTAVKHHPGHNRLYLGYSNGDINYVDLSGDPSEQRLTTIRRSVHRLAAVGDFLLAEDRHGYSSSHHYYYDASGAIREYRRSVFIADDFAWNPELNRIYFTDSTEFEFVHYIEIDPTSASLIDGAWGPHRSSFGSRPPVRVSIGGDKLLVGMGDIFDANDLTWQSSIPGEITDGLWLDQDALVVVLDDGAGNTRLEHRDASGAALEKVHFDGPPVAVVAFGDEQIVITDQARPSFHRFVPGGDKDGDGIANTADNFPDDPAASWDGDGDNYPDAWNAGMSEVDSTSGLMLDRYPSDSACYLPEHGDGTVCDISSRVPSHIPDQILSDAQGVVYMLSTEQNRVFRWDPVAGDLNPFLGGADDTVTLMSYSPEFDRLYVGHESGKITFRNLTGPDEELYFASMSRSIAALESAGDYVLAAGNPTEQGRSSPQTATFDSTGSVAFFDDYSDFSKHTTWNAALGRVYMFDDDISLRQIEYRSIDQSSGQLGFPVSWDSNNRHAVLPPMRLSPDGSKILLGTGNIYDANDITLIDSIPDGLADANWDDQNGTVILRDNNGNTQLERRDNTGTVDEVVYFTGTPLAITPYGNRYVVTTDRGRPYSQLYTPSVDLDGDGINNAVDDFPTDRAASTDSDGDGYPDAWNAGMTESDSTTGLTLDSYPNDSACFLTEHGDGSTCNIGTTIPDYFPASIQIDDAGVIYLFSPENDRVYRWDSGSELHLNPIVVGTDRWLGNSPPSVVAYHSNHDRLYLGYPSGDIKYVALAGDTIEQQFAKRSRSVQGLADVGNFLLAQDDLGLSASHHIYDATGLVRSTTDGSFYSQEYAWNALLARVYFFRDGWSPNDLHYEEVDQINGLVSADRDTPYHGEFEIAPPIRISVDGNSVLLGSGDIYNATDLTWSDAIPGEITDARWRDQGDTVVLRASNGRSRIERRDAEGSVTEIVELDGTPVAMLPANGAYVVVTDQGQPEFTRFVPSDDTDGDSVSNTVDAFPLDPAAAVDSDGDGHPDTWNAGMTDADSTGGLSLDAYPDDSACFMPDHGDGTRCDIAGAIGEYIPVSVEIDSAGIVYLFSPDHHRIYRWDSVSQEHLNPFITDANRWFDNPAPTIMGFHSLHSRLYLGYTNGDITYFDLAEEPVERHLTTLAVSVDGLADAGNFLLARDDSRTYGTHYILDADGTLATSENRRHYSSAYDWNPVLDRLYFFRDYISANQIHYEDIDQVTGAITALGESWRGSEFLVAAPIRVSVDGSKVLVGSGSIFDANDPARVATLPIAVVDADWLSDGRIASVRVDGSGTMFEIFNTSYAAETSMLYPNPPLALVKHGENIIVVTEGAQPVFDVVTP